MMLNIGAFDPALLGEWRQSQSRVDAAAMAESILGLVSDRFQMPVWRLKSKQRDQRVAFDRQVAMYLLRKCVRRRWTTKFGEEYGKLKALGFSAIGEVFGRDHSTAIHGYKIIAARMAQQPAFRARIEALMAEVGQ